MNAASTVARRRTLSARAACTIAGMILLAGCATPPAAPDIVVATPEPGRAIVLGWGSTTGEQMRAALTPTPYGPRVTSLYVTQANEQKSGRGDNNTVRLPPGEYALTVSCGLYLDYRYFTDEPVIHVSLRAERVYRLRPNPQGRRCEPTLEDVTGRDK